MAHPVSLADSAERVRAAKRELGDALLLLGHHYQHDRVIQHMDIVGDSLELARKIPGASSRFIVFCGVFFMAESAAILTKPGQEVYIPAPDAKCVMSETAPAALVETVLRRLSSRGRRVIPLAYVNSSAAVKALCGKYGGAVCTSANAKTMLVWAFKQGDGVLFLPDRNLGQNTANQLGLPEQERLVLDIRGKGERFSFAAADAAPLLLWPGCCAVHQRFSVAQIQAARAAHGPDARVAVHPECSPEVVAAADGAGSTSFLINYAREAPDGGAVIVGTEINLVQRLAERYAGRKRIVPLAVSACTNMGKGTEDKLALLLEGLVAKERSGAGPQPVRVDVAIAEPAALALQRMLDACA
jgi:quinolinate synthase